MDKKQRYQLLREKELKPIQMGDIQKRFNVEATKEGSEWIIKYNGVEIRNKKRQEALNDLATISGYRIERGQSGSR